MGTTRLGFETDLDKCINTLATVKARCKFRLRVHRCKPSKCRSCVTYNEFISAASNMPPVDRLRLNQEADDIYSAIISKSKHSAILEPKTLGHTVKVICFAFVLFFILSALLTVFPFIMPRDSLRGERIMAVSDDSRHDKFIKRILRETEIYVTDVNNDREINCIDYAVTFYKLAVADGTYSDAHFEIVVNYNVSTGMNHMFIKFYVDGRVYAIEPQSRYNDGSYLMKYIWGYVYNPVYDSKEKTRHYLLLYDKGGRW